MSAKTWQDPLDHGWWRRGDALVRIGREDPSSPCSMAAAYPGPRKSSSLAFSADSLIASDLPSPGLLAATRSSHRRPGRQPPSLAERSVSGSLRSLYAVDAVSIRSSRIAAQQAESFACCPVQEREGSQSLCRSLPPSCLCPDGSVVMRGH